MSSPPTTRKRVAIACTPCRSKKIRCDGRLPSCVRCTEIGATCVYNHQADKRKPPSKHYVEALLSRIAMLERKLHSYELANALGPNPSGQPDAATNEAATTAENPINLPGHLFHYPEREALLANVPEDENDPVNSLTQLYGHLDVAEDGHLRYFGAPSYFNLLRRPQYQPDSPEHASLVDEPQEYGVINSGLPLELQNELLQLFWTFQNPWQYLVHKRIFCEALQKGKYTSYCTPLLLQSILALSARYSDRPELRESPEHYETAGDALADQAKGILHFELESPTLATVTAMALLSLREMSVNKEALGWMLIGMAIRLAYNLGLNHDCKEWVKQKKISQDEAEIRIITWWGCFLLDKLFHLGLGRPGMIQQRDISVDKPSFLKDQEFGPWECNTTLGTKVSISTSRSVSNLHYMYDIFEIAAEPLEEIYAPNSRLSFSEKEEKASKTYAEMCRIYNGLPGFLKLSGSSTVARPAHVYSLHIQYHMIAILLHRPFLKRRKEKDRLVGLAASEEAHHNEVCSHAAEKISSHMRAYRMHFGLRQIPISTVHSVGLSATIHLLGATSPDAIAARTSARLLNFNMRCLQEMSTAWLWSQRAIRSLQILAEDWNLSEIINPELKQHALQKISRHRTSSSAGVASISSSQSGILTTDPGMIDLTTLAQGHQPQPLSPRSAMNVPVFDLDHPMGEGLPPSMAFASSHRHANPTQAVAAAGVPGEQDENLDWLVEFQTGATDATMKSMQFDQHVWGFEF